MFDDTEGYQQYDYIPSIYTLYQSISPFLLVKSSKILMVRIRYKSRFLVVG